MHISPSSPKYVKFVDGSVVLFPANVSHDSVMVVKTEEFCGPQDMRPVSAGRFSIDMEGRVEVGGFSTTLNLSARPEDAVLIEQALQIGRFK